MVETPAQIGAFPVRRVLGQGAAGSVFLCDHPRLGLPVAVKVLHERDPDALLRFRREAELMSRIKHPGVVEVFEAGVSEAGPYLALEYCPGQDLASFLRERGALPPREAAALVARLARAVAAAHEAGVIHRDLKPHNVLVLAEGPKVTDFGIARGGQQSALESLTQSGVILGTPAYMAPEQARSARGVDERSDVYALGVILYECLSGRLPFPGKTALEVLNRVVAGEADPLPGGLPPELVEAVGCAMAPDPDDRYRSATYLAEALEAAAGAGASSKPRFFGAALGGLLAGAILVAALGAQGLLEPELAAATPAVSPSLSASDVSPRPSASSEAPRQSETPRLTPAGEAPSEDLRYPSEAHFRRTQEAWRANSAAELERLVGEGSLPARTILAHRYHGGLGVELDRVRARELWEREAERGSGDALFALGVMAERGGEGARAEELLRRARALGSQDAAWHLARDALARARALELARENAGRGDPSAIVFLAEHAFRLGERDQTLEWVARGVALELPQAFALRARLERQKILPDLELMAADYLRAAEAQSPEGICGYARCLALGIGVEKDFAEAARYLQRAERARPNWTSVERLVLLWARGEARAWSRAVEAFLEAEEAWLPRHLWGELGLHMHVAADKLRSEKARSGVLHAAAKFFSRCLPIRSLDGRVCFQTGLAIEGGQIPVEGRDRSALAVQLYARAAKLGYARGTYAFGYALLVGRGVEQDLPKGLRLVEGAAGAGVTLGWERLGDLYHSGIAGKVSPDRAKSRDYYEKAAQAGRPEGMFKYANALLTAGEEREGARWAKRASDHGSKGGAACYANCLLRGRGVVADPAAAHRLLASLAETEPVACEILAAAYRDGLGVAADLERAQAYAARAEELRAQRKARR